MAIHFMSPQKKPDTIDGSVAGAGMFGLPSAAAITASPADHASRSWMGSRSNRGDLVAADASSCRYGRLDVGGSSTIEQPDPMIVHSLLVCMPDG